MAGPNEVRAAIEALSEADLAKLVLAGKAAITNTPFTCHDDIINQMVVVAMAAKGDAKGHRWYIDVPFIAYAIKTIGSIAMDSRKAFERKNMRNISALGPDFSDVGRLPGLGNPFWCDQSIEDQIIEVEEEMERGIHAAEDAKDAAAIKAHFEGDDDVLMLIYCLEECDSNKKAKEATGWNTKKYETVRRRLRRGVDAAMKKRRLS